MSRKREKYCDCEMCKSYRMYMEYYTRIINNINSFRYLVILILVILQFTQGNEHFMEGKQNYRSPQLIDNSILFIITIYFLSCCITDC